MFSSVFLFFEFTPPEIFLILFVVLLLFGGDKLPGLARGLGKGIRDFKDASEGVKREINNQIDNYDKKKEDAKPEETPLIAENSTDNLEGKKEDTPSETVTPVANTIPAGTTHTATDSIEHNHMYDGTPESNEELHAHYRGGDTHVRETPIPGTEPEKKANE